MLKEGDRIRTLPNQFAVPEGEEGTVICVNSPIAKVHKGKYLIKVVLDMDRKDPNRKGIDFWWIDTNSVRSLENGITRAKRALCSR